MKQLVAIFLVLLVGGCATTQTKYRAPSEGELSAEIKNYLFKVEGFGNVGVSLMSIDGKSISDLHLMTTVKRPYKISPGVKTAEVRISSRDWLQPTAVGYAFVPFKAIADRSYEFRAEFLEEDRKYENNGLVWVIDAETEEIVSPRIKFTYKKAPLLIGY